MEIRQLNTFNITGKAAEVKPFASSAGAVKAREAEVSAPEQKEVFSPTGGSLVSVAAPSAEREPAAPDAPRLLPDCDRFAGAPLTWQDSGVTFSGLGNGPIVALQESTTRIESSPASPSLTFAEMLKGISSQVAPSTGQAMSQRESGYLQVFPFKSDEAALKTRQGLNDRYNDPSTSAQSMTQTITKFAQDRGIAIDAAPPSLVGELSTNNLDQVKAATQGIVDKLFLSKETSFNPEKHKTVSKETERFLDLAMQAAPSGFTAADAYKLTAGNLALISYQDKAAAENMLGDHGVRHLLGHNIVACEQLADGLETQGVPVNSMDRLVMHQAMIVHDLGYAMDSVRNPINSEGLRGQDAGHNVLAARYLRERSQNPEDPLAKLFGQNDLERMHRCVLYHDKDVKGGPGVSFNMSATPSEEDRAVNLETMTRIADNSHAFEDKLPELLYRKPQSLKTLRLMKTAGELGDGGLVDTLRGELAQQVGADQSLAKDDREALLQSVSSIAAKSYQFSVGRIAGSKPTFDVDGGGKVTLTVAESDTHQQTVALFGMPSYGQLEKFVKDCSGERVTLSGQDEIFDGQHVSVHVQGAATATHVTDQFNSGLQDELLNDKPFISYSLVDSTLSSRQSILQEKIKLGETGLEGKLAEVQIKRRALLDQYRSIV